MESFNLNSCKTAHRGARKLEDRRWRVAGGLHVECEQTGPGSIRAVGKIITAQGAMFLSLEHLSEVSKPRVVWGGSSPLVVARGDPEGPRGSGSAGNSKDLGNGSEQDTSDGFACG